MKSMKVKLLKKLKTIGHCKQERVLRLQASDGYIPSSPPSQAHSPFTPIIPLQSLEEEPEIIEVSELMKDLEDDEEMELLHDKENITPVLDVKNSQNFITVKANVESFHVSPLSEIHLSSFKEQDLDWNTRFQQTVTEQAPPTKAQKLEEKINPLLDFEEKCPPGGSNAVILYTTGLRGIPKTFEDCENTRFLLQNFGILFLERDISMHSEFKEELWGILGQKMLPPRLFIKGRYIGGAEKVFALHEQGKLKVLLEGIPVSDVVCGGCGGMRIIVCFRCNGSRKIHVVDDDGNGEWKKCPHCNENGLIVCPLCC